MNKKILLLLLLVMLTSNVLAIGVTPGRKTFDYVAGKEETVQFTVVNSDHRDMDVAVFAQGELADYLAFSDVSFTLDASEESKALSYILRMPLDLEPGDHTAEVVVMQLSSKTATGGTFIGAATGVTTQINVFVPFPGKFIEAEMNVLTEDDTINFVIPVQSRGGLDIVRLGGVIDIFSSFNEQIDSINTNTVSLSSKQRGEIAASWQSDVTPGPYRAVATIVYDEQTVTVEKEFAVGKRRLTLEGIEVNDFSLGEIAKFEILVKNEWNQPIEGSFVQMQVFNEKGEVMADFKSANYDLPQLEKTSMVAFWDTEGVQEEKYDATLFLRYGENSEQENLELDVKKNEIIIIGAGFIISPLGKAGEGGMSMTILISVIVLLIVINLSWFIFLRKRFQKRIK